MYVAFDVYTYVTPLWVDRPMRKLLFHYKMLHMALITMKTLV